MCVATKVVCFVCQIVEQRYLNNHTVCTNEFDRIHSGDQYYWFSTYRLMDKSSEVTSIDTHRKGILSN